MIENRSVMPWLYYLLGSSQGNKGVVSYSQIMYAPQDRTRATSALTAMTIFFTDIASFDMAPAIL
jgi:hypothetical protein